MRSPNATSYRRAVWLTVAIACVAVLAGTITAFIHLVSIMWFALAI